MPSPEDSESWDNVNTEETKSQWYLILLTLSIGGLQIAWSVELSNGSVSSALFRLLCFLPDHEYSHTFSA